MKIRWTHGPTALRGIALVLALTSLASAQDAPQEDEAENEDAECTPSRAPHECSDRCPDYDTCFVSDEPRLFYRVGEERFECDGLDCAAASVTLGDYCCRRGEYAPSSNGGGGCTLGAEPLDAVSIGAAALGALAACATWRKRRAWTRGGRPPR